MSGSSNTFATSSHTPFMSPAPDSVRSRSALGMALVIAVASALVYSNTFDVSFHFDDISNIIENERLRDLSRLWPPSGRRWLGYLSFAMNYRLGALDVFGYHVANLVIHVCNGLLVLWLTRMTLGTPALRRAELGPLLRRYLPVAAGLLFAVHPVATQAVTYVVQRFTSLATLFYLLSLALYVQARLSLEADRPSKLPATCTFGLSVVMAAAAMKTKEISFTLPLMAGVYELLFFGLRRPLRLLLLVPLAATALLVPLSLAPEGLRLDDALAHAARLPAEAPEIPRWVYLVTEFRVIVTYLRLLVLPVRQNLDYDYRFSLSLFDPDVLFAIAVLVAIAGLAALLLVRARRTNRAPGVLVFFGVVWFFVALSVESTVVPITDVIFEHRMYLPTAGAAVALGTGLLWVIERLRLRAPLAAQCAVGLLMTAGPLGAAAYSRNLVWKNDLTLWSDVVAKSPEKARPHNFLGLALFDSGATDEAMREYAIALTIRPSYPEALMNLGYARWAKGELDGAMRAYREAVRLAPGIAMAHNNLGATYERSGHVDDAEREYREAIRLAPRLAEPHRNLVRMLTKQDRAAEVLEEVRRWSE